MRLVFNIEELKASRIGYATALLRQLDEMLSRRMGKLRAVTVRLISKSHAELLKIDSSKEF